MQMPNTNKKLSEDAIDKVLAQRQAELSLDENEQPKTRMISLQMPAALVQRCEEMAKRKNLTRSGLIKLALTEFLEQNEK